MSLIRSDEQTVDVINKRQRPPTGRADLSISDLAAVSLQYISEIFSLHSEAIPVYATVIVHVQLQERKAAPARAICLYESRSTRFFKASKGKLAAF